MSNDSPSSELRSPRKQDKKAVGLKFLGMKIRILSQDSAFLMWRLNPISEAQNGYGFGMIPGHGPRDVQFSSLRSDGSPACKQSKAPELENCASRGPCTVGRGVNPTFHSQMSTPDQPLHQIT